MLSFCLRKAVLIIISQKTNSFGYRLDVCISYGPLILFFVPLTVSSPMNLVTGLWGMNVHVPGQDIEEGVSPSFTE